MKQKYSYVVTDVRDLKSAKDYIEKWSERGFRLKVYQKCLISPPPPLDELEGPFVVSYSIVMEKKL